MVGFLLRMVRLVSNRRPDVIYSMLPTSNLVALLLSRLGNRAPVIWGLRASLMQPASYDWLGRLMQWAERRLAGHADGLIANSRAGLRLIGTRPGERPSVRLIRNALDAARFFPRPDMRLGMRKALGVEDSALLVGLVGRLDPMKGHEVFLEAAMLLRRRRSDVRFAIVGAGRSDRGEELRRRADHYGIADDVVWCTEISDMVAFYSAIDLLCSASIYGEGFSNVLAEAMACECRCVATDVGDAVDIVGRWGRVVPPGDAANLALAMDQALAQPRGDEGPAMRRHILDLCGKDEVIAQTEQFMLDLSGMDAEASARREVPQIRTP